MFVGQSGLQKPNKLNRRRIQTRKTSKKERFAKIVNGSILDVWQCSEYASVVTLKSKCTTKDNTLYILQIFSSSLYVLKIFRWGD